MRRLAVTGAVLLCSASAHADDARARAKVLFGKAEYHYDLREFDKALELYTEAYKLKPLPGFLFNIAQCHRHLTNWKQALFFYERYLPSVPETSTQHRAEVEGFIEQCRGQLAAKEARTSEVPPVVPAPRPASPPAAPNPVAVQPDEPGLNPGMATPSPSASPSDLSLRRRRRKAAILLWTGVGASAALLAAGTITGAVAAAKNDEYRDPQTSDERAADLEGAGKPLGIVSVIALSLGGAAAVATGLHYWLSYRPLTRGDTRVTLVPSSRGAGVMLGGWF